MQNKTSQFPMTHRTLGVTNAQATSHWHLDFSETVPGDCVTLMGDGPVEVWVIRSAKYEYVNS